MVLFEQKMTILGLFSYVTQILIILSCETSYLKEEWKDLEVDYYNLNTQNSMKKRLKDMNITIPFKSADNAPKGLVYHFAVEKGNLDICISPG